MCQYRYYYFGGCRHQQTVLYDFCEKALPPEAHAAKREQPSNTARQQSRPSARGARDGGSKKKGKKVRSITRQKEDSPAHPPGPSSTSSRTKTTSATSSIGSSAPNSFASDSSSLQHQSQLSRRHTAASTHDMATLSRVGRWFTGSTAAPSQGTTPVTTTGEISTEHSHRARNSAYREATDESSNMPDSFNAQHFNSDENRAPSFATDMTERSQRDRSRTTGDLESQVDRLKEQLSQAEEKLKRTKQNASGMADDEYPPLNDSRSRTLQPQSAARESAAARLQRQHELAQKGSPELSSPKRQTPAPPSACDFPDLSQSSDGKSGNRRNTNQDTRKPSYAAMAVIGVKDAIDRDFPGPQKANDSDITSEGFTSGATAQSSIKMHSDAGTSQTSFEEAVRCHTEGDLDDGSVIITPINITRSDAIATVKASPTSPGKSSPRFAQPTKAFARRADETLRKESVSPATKITQDGTATKSVRSTAQRQQKRKSLPGAWMNSSNPSSAEASPSKDSTPPAKTESGKKTSSFMSPTKATTRREIATLGQETIKRTSPRVQKSLPRINTAIGTIKPQTASELAVVTSAGTESSNAESFTSARTELPSAGDRTASSAVAETDLPVHVQLPRRSTVGSPSVDVISAQAKAAGLPAVPNTTAKRRGSHGHLLLPIKAKLDRYGLWNESLSSNESQAEASPVTTSLPTVREALPETPPQRIASQETTESRPKFVPPHVRHKQRMEAEAAASTVVIKAAAGASVTNEATKNIDSTPLTADSASQPPSLRATAAEFKPMFQPGTFKKELDELNRTGVLGFKDHAEWSTYSFEEKDAFRKVRELVKSPRTSSATMPTGSPFRGSSKAANRRYWQELAAQQQSTPQSMLDPNDDTFSYPPVQAGQVLRPEIDPQTQMVRWIMEDTRGNKAPISFGRAPAPNLGSPSTPGISPTSDDSSPRFPRADTPRGWKIGSLVAGSDYAWAGGDGKEIKFNGYAPHAERDPNSAVSFSLQGRTASMAVGPRMIGGSEDDNTAPLAPRSRLQWAQKMECPMVPCDTIEITQAVEIPFAQDYMPGSTWEATQCSGFCFDCTAPPVVPV